MGNRTDWRGSATVQGHGLTPNVSPLYMMAIVGAHFLTTLSTAKAHNQYADAGPLVLVGKIGNSRDACR